MLPITFPPVPAFLFPSFSRVIACYWFCSFQLHSYFLYFTHIPLKFPLFSFSSLKVSFFHEFKCLYRFGYSFWFRCFGFVW
jgi:hypothetical protein